MIQTFEKLVSDPAFFDVFFDSSPLGINLCQIDGQWLRSNSAFLRIIGYSAEEADNCSLNFRELTPRKYDEEEKVQLDSLTSKGTYGPYEKELIRKDGSLIPVRLNSFLYVKDGEAFIWSVIEDISKEKGLQAQLLESSERSRSILENLPVAVFVKDSQQDWRFIVWNRKAEEMFQLGRERVLGKTDYDLFPKDQSDFFRAKDIEALYAEDTIDIKEEPVDVEGQPQRWIRTSKRPMKDASDKPRYLLGITQDITDERAAEKGIQEAIEAANKSSSAKSVFLSNMSHEIRTPLHSILGVSDLLSKTDLSAEQATYLSLQRQAGRRLLNLVNDILDFSKLESGRMAEARESELLRPLLSSIIDLLEVSATKKGIVFEASLNVPEDLIAIIDNSFVHQILNNIISNAIKFTPAGGSVRVDVEIEFSKDSDRDALLIAVSDTGVGISGENQRRVFYPFEQVDGSVRKQYGGTGLGLAIVRRLVERLEGEISLTSALGEGTKIEVSLPLTIVGRSPNRGRPSTSVDAPTNNSVSVRSDSRKRVLLADDVEDNRFLVEAFLSDMPIDLEMVEDGQQAVESYQDHKPDLILMDVGMPIMDGLEAARKIREIEQASSRSKTPIVALTGYTMHEDIQACLRAGCDDHLAKPFDPVSLKAVVAKQLDLLNKLED